MTGVDLSQLRIDESTAKPRAPLGPRILALGVTALLVAVAMTFLWPILRPARIVSTAPIHMADVAGPTSTIATAEAVGWVEPEPFPTEVKPLVAGRIRTIEVLEGAEVVGGETLLATLESAALQAAHDRARAKVTEREHEAAVAAARKQRAIDHRNQHAMHRGELAAARLTLADKTVKLVTARGKADELAASSRAALAARTAQERLTQAGSGHAVALERAKAEAAAAEIAARSAASVADALQDEVKAADAAVALHTELIENPITLENDILIATAELESARQRLASANTDLEIAARELGWANRVVSPINGIVMRLTSAPGHTAGPGAEPIVAIYDPKKLQARIDVPLDSVAGVHAGQRVELRSEITGSHVVHGEVLRVQHETDLLKNTLQVKIRLIDPPAVWRPETLCRASFLGSEETAATTESNQPAIFRLPAAAVRGDRVFVIDPASGRARAIAVEVLGNDEDSAIVRGPLSVTQRVIEDQVEDGESVQEQNP